MPLYTLGFISFIATALAAFPPDNKYCGFTNADRNVNGCINYGKGKDHVDSSSWTNDRDHLTWKQCKDTCEQDSTCRSFGYSLSDNEYGNNYSCSHYNVSVAGHTEPCQDWPNNKYRGDYFLGVQNYWDAGCPDYELDLSGTNPSEEDAFCSFGRAPDITKIAANQIRGWANDSSVANDADCKQKCLEDDRCKAFALKFGGITSKRSVSAKLPRADGDTNFLCVLYSQREHNMINETYQAAGAWIPDRNCKLPLWGPFY